PRGAYPRSRGRRSRAGERAARAHRAPEGREHREAHRSGRARSDAEGAVMSEVLLERPAEAIAVVRLNRPEVRNALNLAVRERLAEHFRTLGSDEVTRCIILTGGEKVFAGGADIRDMVERTAIDMMTRHSERLREPIASCA